MNAIYSAINTYLAKVRGCFNMRLTIWMEYALFETMKPKSPPTKKPVRARRMWLRPNNETAMNPIIAREKAFGFTKPVLVLPGDKESVERMVEQGAEQIYDALFYPAALLYWENAMRPTRVKCRKLSAALLRSLGIHPLK